MGWRQKTMTDLMETSALSTHVWLSNERGVLPGGVDLWNCSTAKRNGKFSPPNYLPTCQNGSRTGSLLSDAPGGPP